jgi:hypothetical protein
MGIISPKKDFVRSKLFVFLFLTIFLPIALLYLIFYLLWGVFLYIAIWLTWKSQSVLFVYSDSPIWKDYMESEIIPRIQNQAVILNWSERKTWKTSLPVAAFRYFGTDRNFNPIAMVFRPFHFVKTYRFFEAFKDFKHGNPRKVEELKNALFNDLEIKSRSSKPG